MILKVPFYEMNFGKRPAEELYDLEKDPDQTKNVAAQAQYAAVRLRLRERLDDWMRETKDPRYSTPAY